ncbi:MAG: branched-chain amino acid ABC transporter permease [Bacillota bacterium]|nr:branched-chain amino acid ABC transporter permease [Bacillota bacterium]
MYLTVVSVNIGIFILLALSLNIISGYAGQPSLGHAAFFGIGAYTSAILTTNYGMSFWLSIPFAFLAAGIMGGLLGLISIRMRDDFLAITTIGINFVIVAVFQYSEFFGGSLGMSLKRPHFFGMRVTATGYLALVALMILGTILLILKMKRSWFGLALSSIRNDETAAASFGIDVNRYKVLAFTIGTAIAGMTGAVYAHHMTFIYSSDFAFIVSISILSMVVIGGIGTIRGPIFGAILLGAAPELFRFFADYRMIVYGGLLVFMMRFQSQGFLGYDSILIRFFKKLFPGNLKKKEGEVNG